MLSDTDDESIRDRTVQKDKKKVVDNHLSLLFMVFISLVAIANRTFFHCYPTGENYGGLWRNYGGGLFDF